MLRTLPYSFDRFDTNANLRPAPESGGWPALTASQRDMISRRFGRVAEGRLRVIADYPGAASFPRPPPDAARALSAARRHNASPWRGPQEGEYFNETVHADWLCLGARAFARGASTDTDSQPYVVSDALVMVDRATRLVMVTPVASHSEFADCVEGWIHRYGCMRTLATDGEPANLSDAHTLLRTHYGIAFRRVNAPYHSHHNAPAETTVHQLKRLASTLCSDGNIAPGAHWPLALAHAEDILNVLPRTGLEGDCALQRLHGRAPSLRYFHAFGCRAYVLAVGAYKAKGILRPHAVEAVYIGTGWRRGMSGAMFALADGRHVVSQHYRVDETRFPGLPRQVPPGVALAAIATPRRPRRDPVLARDAQMAELRNLARIGTFAVHTGALPPGARPVASIFVFKTTPDGGLKLNSAGEAKARLCLRGDETERGIGVPTYSPCIPWPAFLMFCALAALHRASVAQCDVVNAYVQADLHRRPGIPPTYMQVTSAMRPLLAAVLPAVSPATRWLRVLRALYGLRESALLFHEHFSHILIAVVGFRTLGGEDCFFILRHPDGGFIAIVLHVDDFLYANCGTPRAFFADTWDRIVRALTGLLKTSSPSLFLGTDLELGGPAPSPSLAGIALARTAHLLHIACTAHIDSAVGLYLPGTLPPRTDVSVPMSHAHYIAISRGRDEPLAAEDPRVSWFRSVLGVANWAASRCRPDIAFVAHYLSRDLSRPTTAHIAAATHLLHYLRLTRTHGLLFRGGGHALATGVPDKLVVYHDATFAGEPIDSSSVSGVIAYINGTPMFWHVAKVSYVARSSTESELYGCDDALLFLDTFAELFQDIARESPMMAERLDLPCPFLTDNSGLVDVINSVDNGVARTLRHVRTRLHRIRTAVRDGRATVSWTPASRMHADILTKCQSADAFIPLRDSMVHPAPDEAATP